MLQLFVIEDGTQLAHGVFFVLGLVSGLGVFDENFFVFAGVWVYELVAQTYAGFDFIDVLSAGTTAAEGVPRYGGRVDFDFDGVVY